MREDINEIPTVAQNDFLIVTFTKKCPFGHWTVLACVYAKSLQSCPTLCDPMDGSPPGFSVHGILQARILESVAISYSRGSSWPRFRTWVSCVSRVGRQILYHCPTWEALLTRCTMVMGLLNRAWTLAFPSDQISLWFWTLLGYYCYSTPYASI